MSIYRTVALDLQIYHGEKKEIKDLWRIYKVEGGVLETVTNCNQLKLKVLDGKYYNAGDCDIEEMFIYIY